MNIAIIAPFLILVVAALTSLQPLVNAKLNNHVDSPIWVSFISFATGTILLLVIGLVLNGKFMEVQFQGLKWWMFISGALGAAYITTALIVVPYLGVATMATLATCSVLICAALLDHYGVLTDAPKPINLQKMFGMTLLAIAAIITMKA